MTAKIYSLGYNEIKTYFFALLFILGNILLPQLCHLIPQGGLIFLPIYFFTLFGAYKYGIIVGLLTASISPLANHFLFGMPAAGVLPAIIIKSGILAIAAAYFANHAKDVSLWAIFAAVACCQLFGSAIEWMITKDLFIALQDIRLAIPGILIQIFGGYALLKATANK